jgi:hypothetical protein
LVSGGTGRGCGKMPVELVICPTCDQGIKPHRGYGWIDPRALFEGRHCKTPADCASCPVADLNLEEVGPIGTIWVGSRFYPTPASFLEEARELGISRRVPSVPKGLMAGVTWIALCHRQVPCGPDREPVPGIFYLFRPERIEKVITESDTRDQGEMERLAKRGITPFIVPDGDPDHDPHGRPAGENDLDDLFDDEAA